MYRVDERDGVVELRDIPQSSVGAPLPLVLAKELRVVLAYYLQATPPGWDGTSARLVSSVDSDEPIAIVQFDRCRAHLFGPPNDEAFSGHTLAGRGLTPYAVFEVTDSSWIRALERMNSVHPNHDAKHFFAGKRHLIFAFHDSTFECVCAGFQIHLARGSLRSAIPKMAELLE